MVLLSLMEPQNFAQDNKNEHLNKSMNEELDQIEKNQTLECVPRPKDKNSIGTKWVYRSNLNEDGKVFME